MRREDLQPSESIMVALPAKRIGAVTEVLLVDLPPDHLLLSMFAFAGAFEMFLTLLLGPVASNLYTYRAFKV